MVTLGPGASLKLFHLIRLEQWVRLGDEPVPPGSIMCKQPNNYDLNYMYLMRITLLTLTLQAQS